MFFKGKKREKAVPFCRTSGCPANTEVPPVLQNEVEGQECRPHLPTNKNFAPLVSLQYVQSTLWASVTDTNTQYVKQTGPEMGTWLHSS